MNRGRPFDGTEQMILGNLAILTEGGPVKVAPATETSNPAGRIAKPGSR